MANLSAHITTGLFIVTFLFPRYTQNKRNRKVNHWSQQLVKLMGLSIRVYGTQPPVDQQVMLLANHVSWFDIFAINSVSSTRFVAKSEVSHWPVIGRLCKGAGTLFIEREKRRDTARMNEEIASAITAGHQVAVFPEGTTSDGGSLKPFRSSLLQPAIDCQSIIQPLYLRYIDAMGLPSTTAAYFDEISFGASLWRTLGSKGISVELHYLPPITAGETDTRHTLTKQIEASIRARHDSLIRQPADSSAQPVFGKYDHPQGAVH